MPLGLYVSIPFCRTKCTYCNFASDVFSKNAFQQYVNRVCQSITEAATIARTVGGQFEREADSIYLGGGTPTVLDINDLQRIFVTISQNFKVEAESEVTVEVAPGTLTPAGVEAFCSCGVNRVSLGVQSFVDKEAASVGRLHKRETILADIARLRTAGIQNISVDLIAGLPHQTAESWQRSLEQVIATGVPHVSVYMLEVDQDSRLGRELIAGGTKYHAHFVPDDELTADFYGMACEELEQTGVRQYEISNFAREGFESHHNLKYWTRRPYFGFGVDAHSMLLREGLEAIRFSTPDSLDEYVAAKALAQNCVDQHAALEEEMFLGLRLNRGVNLDRIASLFGAPALETFLPVIREFVELGLLEQRHAVILLTGRGRLLSNEVFERFVSSTTV